MNPTQTLDDILSNGIQIDLYRAEQCFAIRSVIAEHAAGINAASFGDLFGNLQQILHQFAYLSLAKTFELPDTRYPLRSIPAALGLLKLHSSDLPLLNPHNAIEALVKFEHKLEDLNRLTKLELACTLYNEYCRRLPKADEGTTLYVIKTWRDKFISHHEAVNLADLPEVDFEEITNLIQFALGFLQTVGRAYLSVSYSGTVGEFLKTTSAASASRGLVRLLKASGILEVETI